MAHGLLTSHLAEPLLLDAADGETSLTVTLCDSEHARALAEQFAAMSPWSRYPFTAKALAAYLAQQEAGAPRYAIHANGQLAGALGVRLNWLRGPYVQFLGVLPMYQRHGVGRAAMNQLISDARANSDRNVWVAASSFNADALRFYERIGFTRAALLDGLVQENIDEVLMRLRV